MAQYNVNAQVQKLAAMRSITEEALADQYGYKLSRDIETGEWMAGNRGIESRIDRDLYDAKAAKRAEDRKKALAAKLSAGTAVWRKVGDEWLIQVTGREVEAGDMIEVERRDGSKSQQIVRAIISRGADGIYCRA